jgi:nicotinate-nucleotide--dimethylbenzimidazole phosphoribosyltransferase
MGMEPLLDLRLETGEGVASTLAVAVLKAAVACHTGMENGA